MLFIRLKTNEHVAALQYTGDNIKQCIAFAGKNMYCTFQHKDIDKCVYVIMNGNSERPIHIGDYIVLTNDRFYPCNVNTFMRYYDPLDGHWDNINDNWVKVIKKQNK